MLRNASLIVSLALAVLTVGCSNTPVPPPDTRAADVQAVKDIEAAWVKDSVPRMPTSGPATLPKMAAGYTLAPGY